MRKRDSENSGGLYFNNLQFPEMLISVMSQHSSHHHPCEDTKNATGNDEFAAGIQFW